MRVAEELEENLQEIDNMITGLARQGVVDGPRVSLLRRRRTWYQELLREAMADEYRK